MDEQEYKSANDNASEERVPLEAIVVRNRLDDATVEKLDEAEARLTNTSVNYDHARRNFHAAKYEAIRSSDTRFEEFLTMPSS
jgi:hypothetical protein